MLIISTLLLILATLLAVHFWRQVGKLKSCLRQYAGGRIARLAPGEVATTQGRRTTSTICFTDMRGFTKIAETLQPERVAYLLQEIYPTALETIRQEGGEVDKIIGDAVLFRHSDPAAAIKMVEKVQAALNQAAGKAAAQAGCKIPVFTSGLHTGPVFVCLIGSRGGFVDYTTLGDTVNLSSRIQSLCQYYKVSTLVSGDTLRASTGIIGYKLLDVVSVKGRQEPIEIYTKISEIDNWLEFEAARKLYAEGNFSKAKEAFSRIGFSMWAKRCEYLEKAPPQNWRGVWEWKQK